MLRKTYVSAIQRLIGFSPYQARPMGLHGKAPNKFVGAYHKANRDIDDPTRTSTLQQVIIKVCPRCNRSKQFSLSQRYHFHTCCEGETMRMRGTLADAIRKPREIKTLLRKWDFDNNRPWSNPRKPRPKGRSNYGK